ncbi:hypothetical protein [uncultured Polaribacter sp.]|uniref:hypothetical protein n=1 Tax=uncultured Polaribacter sp. TaxID=174711 RepID=UPI0026256A31|nr:hypothetical protein [uncultured Polaribacter sp.]
MEWFQELTAFEQTYWLLTGVATFMFLIVLITTIIGADSDDIGGDVDAEIDADTGAGFQFFTLKNLIAFFTIFGWSGISSIHSGNSKPTTVIVSIFFGLLMMFVMAALFYYISKLTSSGTLKMQNALNATGEVYLTVGANRRSTGKIQIKIQGALRELDALTDYNEDLKQGRIITVTEVTTNGTLIIEPQNKTKLLC